MNTLLDRLFDRFDPGNTGTVNSRYLLDMVDSLDDTLPEDAPPVLSENHRGQAQSLVDAEMPMTREELDGHLADLGVDVGPPRQADTSQTLTRSRLPLPRLGSAVSSDGQQGRIRPTSTVSYNDAVTPSRFAYKPPKQERSYTELSEISLIPQTPSLLKQPSSSRTATAKSVRTIGTSIPLAQSTPRRKSPQGASRSEQVSLQEKENTRPQSNSSSPYGSDYNSNTSFTRPMSQGRQSLGERYHAAASPSSPSMRSDLGRDGPDFTPVRKHIDEMQTKVKQQAHTIDLNEERIQELERQLEERSAELQQRLREVNEGKSARDAADARLHQLEKDLGDVHADKDALQQRWSKAQAELAEQRMTLETLRDNHAKTLSELETLRKELAAALEERDKAHEEGNVLKATVSGLQTQIDQLQSAEERLENAEEACGRYEEQVEMLRTERDEVKQELQRLTHTIATSRGRSPAKPTTNGIRQHSAVRKARTMDRGVQATRDTRSLNTQTIAARLSNHVSHFTQTEPQTEPVGAPPEYSANEQLKRQREVEEMAKQMNLQESLLRKLTSLQKQQKELARRKEETTNPWLRAWVLVVGALVLFMAGYLACLLAPTPATGMTYAEMRAWHNANALDYLLEYRGVLGGSKFNRWWEGGPLWLEKICYWLDEKISDGTPWPS